MWRRVSQTPQRPKRHSACELEACPHTPAPGKGAQTPRRHPGHPAFTGPPLPSTGAPQTGSPGPAGEGRGEGALDTRPPPHAADPRTQAWGPAGQLYPVGPAHVSPGCAAGATEAGPGGVTTGSNPSPAAWCQLHRRPPCPSSGPAPGFPFQGCFRQLGTAGGPDVCLKLQKVPFRVLSETRERAQNRDGGAETDPERPSPSGLHFGDRHVPAGSQGLARPAPSCPRVSARQRCGVTPGRWLKATCQTLDAAPKGKGLEAQQAPDPSPDRAPAGSG